LQPIFNDLTADKLTHLIGNICNLQLRILRKYFNDEKMKSGDIWLPDKLHNLFFKWVRSWHAKQENEKQNRQAILKLNIFTFSASIIYFNLLYAESPNFEVFYKF
jgi:hypothetical protein